MGTDGIRGSLALMERHYASICRALGIVQEGILGLTAEGIPADPSMFRDLSFFQDEKSRAAAAIEIARILIREYEADAAAQV